MAKRKSRMQGQQLLFSEWQMTEKDKKLVGLWLPTLKSTLAQAKPLKPNKGE